jgi:hypothetical protein
LIQKIKKSFILIDKRPMGYVTGLSNSMQKNRPIEHLLVAPYLMDKFDY